MAIGFTKGAMMKATASHKSYLKRLLNGAFANLIETGCTARDVGCLSKEEASSLIGDVKRKIDIRKEERNAAIVQKIKDTNLELLKSPIPQSDDNSIADRLSAIPRQ